MRVTNQASCLTLEQCFGALMDKTPDELRDMPGIPQQVMLAQTLYFIRSKAKLIYDSRKKQCETFEELDRIMQVYERTKDDV